MPQQTIPVSTATSSGPPALAAPAARRLRRPSWRDPRLLVGLALVLGSVVLGALVVQHADDTVPVWAAARALTPGEPLTGADLVVRQVRIAGGEATYLPAATASPPDLVLLRAVGAGELVPTAAVGRRDQVDLRPVAVPVTPDAVDGLGVGALVDVWVAARSAGSSDAYERPRLVASSAQVSGLTATRGALGSTTTSAVRLLLTPELVPSVIEAVDNQARVTLVPVPATLARSGS